MTITIKDVAKKSGVSVATVSRILNGLEGYSPETKQHVLKVIEELGYKRNAIARGLATKTTRTIGVLIPDVSTNFHGEILRGIEDTAHTNTYSVVLCNAGHIGSRTPEYLRVLEERQVDAIIIVSINITDEIYNILCVLKIPYILVSTNSNKFNVPYVKVDDEKAAYTATKYLIEKGHNNIAMIAGSEDDLIAGTTRVMGYKKALLDSGINIDNSLIKYGSFSYDSGIQCMNEFLTENKSFTAVFAASDDMAVGVLNVAYKNNIRVPDDLSVVGYDNTQTAAMAIPPLTTVGQPLYDLGKESIEKILLMLKTDTIVESTIMPHKIIERDSVNNFSII